MRNNSKDRTIERNLAQKWRFLIGEFEPLILSLSKDSLLPRKPNRHSGASRNPPQIASPQKYTKKTRAGELPPSVKNSLPPSRRTVITDNGPEI